MIFTLNIPKTIIDSNTKKSITVNELTVVTLNNIERAKIIQCRLKEVSNRIILWQGAEYDLIGEYSEQDVLDRLLAIL